ncbi:MAG: hypothetical protein CMO55_01480 [Verrucomicrobiales bacterium]|nr:hypothetical protein [Verrucomicrobiales bacterium]
MEMFYESNGKVLHGPRVRGNDLKTKYIDLNHDGSLDVMFVNQFIEDEYAKIIFRPGAPDDQVFEVIDHKGCSIR